MSDYLKKEVLLVGAGPMAAEYAKVLDSMSMTYEVIGRGESACQKFEDQTNHPAKRGGLRKWLAENEYFTPQYSIVAVGVENLAGITIELINAGVKIILVEKPAGLVAKDIQDVAKLAKDKAKVFVAYNRRFYTSTLEAQKIINDDGGVTSFNFEFTEWGHTIAPLLKAPGVKENWFLANSSHVVDLAFFLGGKPQKISSFKSGSLPWHSTGARYAGAGITYGGALFSYSADWESPGRWGVEILTRNHRLILRPLEKLQIQKLGSFNQEYIKLNDDLDNKYKPGIYRQLLAFFNSEWVTLLSIEEHAKNLDFYATISGVG